MTESLKLSLERSIGNVKMQPKDMRSLEGEHEAQILWRVVQQMPAYLDGAEGSVNAIRTLAGMIERKEWPDQAESATVTSGGKKESRKQASPDLSTRDRGIVAPERVESHESASLSGTRTGRPAVAQPSNAGRPVRVDGMKPAADLSVLVTSLPDAST